MLCFLLLHTRKGKYCSCLVPTRVQLFCNPMDYSPPGSSVPGILQEEYWSGLSFSSPGDLPTPGIKHVSPALAGGFFIT